MKQKKEIGLKAVLVTDGLNYFGDWYKMSGDASDGVLDMLPQFTTPPQLAWRDAFEKRFGHSPSASVAGQAYDYVLFFAKVGRRAIEKYKALDSETLFKVGSEEVATGKLTYSAAEGSIIQARYKCTPESAPDPVIGEQDYYFPVVQFKKGKGSNVYPERVKQADLVVE
jgi:branched-chain amino acid transport system substrate-binding protein